MFNISNKNTARKARHLRVRNKISGTAARPRLCVYRSLNNIYCQIIDDEAMNTVASASSMEKEIAKLCEGKSNVAIAQIIGKVVAERALAKGIKSVVFDRAGYIYTGRVKALADAARENGLEF